MRAWLWVEWWNIHYCLWSLRRVALTNLRTQFMKNEVKVDMLWTWRWWKVVCSSGSCDLNQKQSWCLVGPDLYGRFLCLRSGFIFNIFFVRNLFAPPRSCLNRWITWISQYIWLKIGPEFPVFLLTDWQVWAAMSVTVSDLSIFERHQVHSCFNNVAWPHFLCPLQLSILSVLWDVESCPYIKARSDCVCHRTLAAKPSCLYHW